MQRLENFLLVLTLSLMASSRVWAQSQSVSIGPVETTLKNIESVLTGAAGITVAVLGLIAVGILWLLGRLHIKGVLIVVGGIVLVFGARTIVETVKGWAS